MYIIRNINKKFFNGNCTKLIIGEDSITLNTNRFDI